MKGEGSPFFIHQAKGEDGMRAEVEKMLLDSAKKYKEHIRGEGDLFTQAERKAFMDRRDCQRDTKEAESVKCPKCAGEEFVLETEVLLVEKRKIYKNGRVAVRPFSTYEDDDTNVVGECAQVIRCTNCGAGYGLPYLRNELIRMNFSEVDLEKAFQEEE